MTGSRRTGPERGQSTVEFALLVPLVVATLFFVVQVGLLIYGQLAVTHVATEVARVLAVDPSADIGQMDGVVGAPGLNDLRIAVQFERAILGKNETVVVTVSHPTLAVLGRFDGIFREFSPSFTTKMLVH